MAGCIQMGRAAGRLNEWPPIRELGTTEIAYK